MIKELNVCSIKCTKRSILYLVTTMKNRNLILLGFVLLKFFLQYILLSSAYDLQRDEYLHLDQANHLDWGFISVPPVTSWISTLIKWLGNGVFWVKFFPALFGALTMVLVWKTVEKLGGSMFALVLASLGVCFSVLLRLNTLYQPNSLDVLCWTAFLYTGVSYVQSNQSKWLYFAAIVFAIGFLNKYNIAFLLIAMIPAVLLTSLRNIFIKKEFYWAVLIAFVLILPNLIWQYQHQFPFWHHMKLLKEQQLVNVNRLDFLKDQLLFFTGAVFVIIFSLVSFWRYDAFKPFRFLFWTFVFTLSLFTYLKAKNYYSIGLYPIFIAFGAVYITENWTIGWKKVLTYVMMALPLLVFARMYFIAFPNFGPDYILQHQETYKRYGLLRWEDGKDHSMPQDFADMLGWKEMALVIDSVYTAFPNKEGLLVLCQDYGQASAINYYKKNPQLIASSFDADYISWLDLSKKYTDVILVRHGGDEDKDRKEERSLFDTVYLAAKRINLNAREKEISVYILKGAKIDLTERLRKERDEEFSSW